jgi:hypothetical protein
MKNIYFTIRDIQSNPDMPGIVSVTVENGWTVVWFGAMRLKFR